ncbi:hypothetical protein [Streptomyces sp. CBMAI 2042]|uniref:hypothetical protein n=1 Tax=Streptomyces sp. CBMAI 2042 TaxID=2305222 RepID=UPI001F3CF10A|nr:hypothetical protein [Streptomyces sp. CBMAI 2042]
MTARSLEIIGAGIRGVRTIGILRIDRGVAQREVAAWVTVLGHPVSNTMLSRIQRIQRRCCDLAERIELEREASGWSTFALAE